MSHTDLYGIVESSKVASIVGVTITQVANIDQDGDQNIEALEIFNAVQIIAFKVVSNTPDLLSLKQEFEDYTEDEKAELKQILSKETQFKGAKLDTLFDRAFGLALDAVDFAIDIRRPEEDFVSA